MDLFFFQPLISQHPPVNQSPALCQEDAAKYVGQASLTIAQKPNFSNWFCSSDRTIIDVIHRCDHVSHFSRWAHQRPPLQHSVFSDEFEQMTWRNVLSKNAKKKVPRGLWAEALPPHPRTLVCDELGWEPVGLAGFSTRCPWTEPEPLIYILSHYLRYVFDHSNKICTNPLKGALYYPYSSFPRSARANWRNIWSKSRNLHWPPHSCRRVVPITALTRSGGSHHQSYRCEGILHSSYLK